MALSKHDTYEYFAAKAIVSAQTQLKYKNTSIHSSFVC